MTALKTHPRTNIYKIARGQPMIALRRADGTFEHYRPMGSTNGFDLTVETENYQHQNKEEGLNVIDLDTPVSVTRTSNITIDNLNNDNIALFLGATTSTFTQSAASVSAEAVLKIKPERACQLGTSLSLAGVRNISAVVPTVNAAARANSTPYAKGALYFPATPNNHLYACTVAGTSGGSLPTFTTNGTTYSDGTATFIDLGVVNSLTVDVDYVVDATNGLLSIMKTGKLAGVYNAAIAAGLLESEFSINLAVDYTRPLNTRQEIHAGATAAVTCRILFKAANAYGDNQDVLIPLCTLAPSGALAFIGENEVSSVEFAVGISMLDSNTPPVSIIGPSA